MLMLTNHYLPLAWAITPGFFWAGLLLVSIPIIIHILNRRRYKIVQWAAMEYLLQAMRKNRRRIQFEQLLLLAIRCILLALLGLALARPMGCADSTIASLAGQKSGLHIFVIDNSYSMMYESAAEAGKTHLDRAKAIARRYIERLAPGSESVAIIVASKSPTAGPSTRPTASASPDAFLVLRPSFDLRGAADAIDRIDQSFLATDVVGALQAAVQLAREDKKQPQKFLYILSDDTRSAWDRPELVEPLKQLGPALTSAFEKRIRLHDLGRPDQWNLAILDIRPDSGLVTPTFHTDFLADVKGFGGNADTLVQWKWDDKQLTETARIRPDANSAPVRQTKVEIAEGGPHVLSATLTTDDKVRADNTRSRVVEVASAMRVLIVEGSRGTGALSGSGAYLELSLAPRKEIDAAGKVRSSTYVVPEVIPDLEFSSKVLTDYRAVILTSVPSLTNGQADQLARFVNAGGTLILFMGDQVNADLYNAVLLPRKLMPGRLITRKTVPADGKAHTFDFNPNGPLHPALSIFKGEPKTGLDTAQIFTYYQVEAPADTVVLRYVTDAKATPADPAITLHTLGDGHVVFFSSTANSDWNALPQKPSYIPLIHELLANSIDLGDKWMNLTCGQSVEIPSTLKITGTPALLNPLRKPVPVDPVTLASGAVVYRSKPLDKPGLYQLNLGNRTVPIAVNVPSEEADLRTIPAQAVAKALGGIDLQLLGSSSPEGGSALDDSTDFGWTLMFLVLLLAGTECFLAMHFGHHRKPTTATSVVAVAKAA